MYLIPCRLLTSHVLPTKELLRNYPRLQELFLPLAHCIKKGDLRSFDVALQKGEDVFVKSRIYLTLERGRDIALRNLLRKVFVAGGFDQPKEGEQTPVRRTRIPVAEFCAAMCLFSGDELIDDDEVECSLANMIYKVSYIILSYLCERLAIMLEGYCQRTLNCGRDRLFSVLYGFRRPLCIVSTCTRLQVISNDIADDV